MTDEVYEFIQDCKDKKITARSARNKRAHNGKAGRVRLPSDYLTKKEREAMNGECKSYRMNDPISWTEFKSWPEEHQITYIKLLRQKYNTPNTAIANMMGIHRTQLGRYLTTIGFEACKAGVKADFDEDGFYAWCGMVKVNEETPVEETPCETVEEPVVEIDILNEENTDILPKNLFMNASKATEGYNPPHCSDTCDSNTVHICDNPYHNMPVIPARGNMSFCDNDAEDVLQTLKCILSGVRVNMHVSWEVVKE